MKGKGNPIVTVLSTAAVAFLIGVSFPAQITPKLQCGIFYWSNSVDANSSFISGSNIFGRFWTPLRNSSTSPGVTSPVQQPNNSTAEIVARTAKPKGAERLPPNIVVSESDLHLRRLWGNFREDTAPGKYLLALTVGFTEKGNVNATVHKFSENFDVVLFHYDGQTTEWDEEFEWSKKALHISARKQSKWWYAKRFLHPSIVAAYDYIFLWDEDLEVSFFDAEEYVKIAKKHGLEISQPGLDITRGKKTYDVTIRRNGSEIHKNTIGGPGNCSDVHQRPCSGFVEVMAPVFSKEAWTCAWLMIQNDLIHGWGLDHNFWRCVQDPEEQIGVVDAQYVAHRGVPTLGRQGNPELGDGGKVRARAWREYSDFRARMINAERAQAREAAAAAAALHSTTPPRT
ncbi:hypothetical protein PR202_ga14308 [Eleusine coracana subsp. coracana]|uniref:Uncharacterized protein n=1 Tax=Eleusine coracana subsp. coracana TaxID=191504 RepID=A0AAV5CH00_ELECO|nr:hypothetical protein PR202_ga14308 [Eleusine coracana subsp. coracana]